MEEQRLRATVVILLGTSYRSLGVYDDRVTGGQRWKGRIQSEGARRAGGGVL